MLPACGDDEYGLLPPSLKPYPATLDELQERFVNEAPESQRDRRALVYTALSLHVTMIRRLFRGKVRVWVNGGFVTHKQWKAPRDADLVAIVDPEAFAQANSDPAFPLWTLADVTARRGAGGPTLVTPKLHTGFGLTDAYVVRADRPAQVESWRRNWASVTGPNGQTVEGVAKGFVEVVE